MIKFPAIFESFPEVRFVTWSHLYIVNWCTFLLWRHPEVFGDRGTAAFPTPSTVVAYTLRSSTVSKTGFRFTSSNEENTLSFVLVAATSLCRSSWMCDPKLHVLSTVDSWFLQQFFFGIRGACSHGNSRQCQLLRNSNAWHVILIEVKGSPWDWCSNLVLLLQLEYLKWLKRCKILPTPEPKGPRCVAVQRS